MVVECISIALEWSLGRAPLQMCVVIKREVFLLASRLIAYLDALLDSDAHRIDTAVQELFSLCQQLRTVNWPGNRQGAGGRYWLEQKKESSPAL